MNIGNTLNLTAQVYRRDGSTNSLGEPTNVWEWQAEVDCSIHVRPERDRRFDAGLNDKPQLTAFFYPSANVEVEDKLTVPIFDGPTESNVDYRVAAFETPNGRDNLRVAILHEMR